MVWQDTELLVLMQVTDELWKLREDQAAQLRVLRYVADRLGLAVLVLSEKPERCEEIEPLDWMG